MNRLLAELLAEIEGEDPVPVPEAETLLGSTDGTATDEQTLGGEGLHEVRDEVVLVCLDEILLLLIASREGACGKQLLGDVQRLFGTELSPGTVYPHLNDLAEEGAVEVNELTRRKMYTLAEPRAELAAVDRRVNRLLVFALLVKRLSVASADRAAPEAVGRE
ncbi:PadR family transcriptional regulator [Halobaculum sp. MBLA0143]|uniref:PadR family transcriptional regulator n=1 Tax=Halobaculum sp. MBLA0143 TaxID=3079933 RepID=UPI003524CEE9